MLPPLAINGVPAAPTATATPMPPSHHHPAPADSTPSLQPLPALLPSAGPFPALLHQHIDQLPLLQHQQPFLQPNNPPPPHSLPPSHPVSPPDGPDHAKYKRKYASLKRDFRELHHQSEKTQHALSKARKKIDLLRFERRLLLQMLLSQSKKSAPHDDDSDSESDAGRLTAIASSSQMRSSYPAATNALGGGPDDMTADAVSIDDEDAEGTETPGAAPARVRRPPRKRPKIIDPNAPKRPANAYMLFCELQREKLKEQRAEMQKILPGSEKELGLGNLTKALGQRWRSLSGDERQNYHVLFKQQVKQYDRELSNYFKSNPKVAYADMVESASLLPDFNDDVNAPKKPANVFFVFCEYQRGILKEQRRRLKEEMPGSEEEAGLANITKALGQQWRALSDTERQFYHDKFREQLAAYTRYVEQRMSEKGNFGINSSTETKSNPDALAAPTATASPAEGTATSNGGANGSDHHGHLDAAANGIQPPSMTADAGLAGSAVAPNPSVSHLAVGAHGGETLSEMGTDGPDRLHAGETVAGYAHSLIRSSGSMSLLEHQHQEQQQRQSAVATSANSAPHTQTQSSDLTSGEISDEGDEMEDVDLGDLDVLEDDDDEDDDDENMIDL